MKTFNAIAVLFLVLAVAVSAQTVTLTQTSLSSAVNSTTSSTVFLASATNVTVSPATMLYVDKEAMLVLGVSGTTITVARGQSATPSTKHASGAMVLVGSPASFYTYSPSGGCTASATAVTPWVNVLNGQQWLCSTITNSWVPGFGNFSAPAQVTTAVASLAGATTITGPLFHVTGTNAITAWTLPAGEQNAPFCIIPDAAYTTVAGNNIAANSTAVANRVQCWTFDATNSKFVPSYQ